MNVLCTNDTTTKNVDDVIQKVTLIKRRNDIIQEKVP